MTPVESLVSSAREIAERLGSEDVQNFIKGRMPGVKEEDRGKQNAIEAFRMVSGFLPNSEWDGVMIAEVATSLDADAED